MMVVVLIVTGGMVSKCSAISGILEISLIRGRSVSLSGRNCTGKGDGSEILKNQGISTINELPPSVSPFGAGPVLMTIGRRGHRGIVGGSAGGMRVDLPPILAEEKITSHRVQLFRKVPFLHLKSPLDPGFRMCRCRIAGCAGMRVLKSGASYPALRSPT
jgi:hypothetical protein